MVNVKNIEMIPAVLRQKTIFIPISDLQLTNTEVVTVRQTASADTWDLIFLVMRPDTAPNEEPSVPYISTPVATTEQNVAVPSNPVLTTGASLGGGQFALGGGNVGMTLPTLKLSGKQVGLK